MANEEHLAILRRDVELRKSKRRWRKNASESRLCFFRCKLTKVSRGRARRERPIFAGCAMLEISVAGGIMPGTRWRSTGCCGT
jgi:hypothetical protein